MTSVKFTVQNLHCGACAKVVQMRIKKISGVIDVKITDRGQEADGEVKADREISLAEIQAALSGTEYKINEA